MMKLSVISFLVLGLAQTAHAQNFSEVLKTSLRDPKSQNRYIIKITNDFTNYNPELGEPRILELRETLKFQHQEKKYAQFFRKDGDVKSSATEVIMPDGRITQIVQGRRKGEVGKPGDSFDFEAITTAVDGTVAAYSICDVDSTKPEESYCSTITPAVCAAIKEKKLNENELNSKLQACSDLVKVYDAFKDIKKDSELTKAADANIKAINDAQVTAWLLDKKTVKKIDDVEIKKPLQIFGSIIEMSNACNRIRSGKLLAEVAPAHAPAESEAPAGDAKPAK